MKKSIFLLFFIPVFFACNQNQSKVETPDRNSVHDASSTELSLNNGAKWKADSVTNHNVIRLKTTAGMFRVQPFPSIDNYQLLGSDLSNDLNILIEQCKMQGEDHKALHRWLEPTLHLSNELKTVTDTSRAKEIFDSVDVRIDAYPNYFE
ncbi:MAG: hypothetical protein ABIO82_00060 [Ginsengibacter sp.]